jgi:U4/U6 small nuclear ribonucleoprotein PRP3
VACTALVWPLQITLYVEHPVPIEPPAEEAPPPPQPLKLTTKELKKLRTQRRLAREKEKQELIRWAGAV